MMLCRVNENDQCRIVFMFKLHENLFDMDAILFKHVLGLFDTLRKLAHVIYRDFLSCKNGTFPVDFVLLFFLFLLKT